MISEKIYMFFFFFYSSGALLESRQESNWFTVESILGMVEQILTILINNCFNFMAITGIIALILSQQTKHFLSIYPSILQMHQQPTAVNHER